MNAQSPLNGYPIGADLSAVREIHLNSRTHGQSRVPGASGPKFSLAAFGQSLEGRDVERQLARYWTEADIRIVDSDNPPAFPRRVRGRPEIRDWLLATDLYLVDVEVIHLVDGGDRVAFTERRRYSDGSEVQSTSTAELEDGLITTQHTILVGG